VFPLFYECDSRDVLLVLLNPLEHAATPAAWREIETRIGELSFSANSCDAHVCPRGRLPARITDLGRLSGALAAALQHD
jgi:hypothetical protein